MYTMWLVMKARKLLKGMNRKIEFEKKKETNEKEETVSSRKKRPKVFILCFNYKGKY